ncbi:MAG: phosphotransferase [Pseudomonadota bacterium]
MTPPQTEPRRAALEAFVHQAGYDPRALSPLAGDASNRRYLRLGGARPLVVMDAPPERGEDVRPFLAITQALQARSLSAPAVVAADPEHGFILLEDLGDALYARVASERPADEQALYTAAVDLLAECLAEPPASLAPYDGATLRREARLALDWYYGEPPPPSLGAEFEALIDQALVPVATERSAFVLRDYHAENLLWLDGRTGHARVGLLDYQDALAGHPAYDLISLIEDARRGTSPELRAAMLARFLERRPDLDPPAFRAACAALGAQRNLKIIGIFARLARRDAKPRYLGLIPRVWDHLSRDLAHPDLAPLQRLVVKHLPPPDAAHLARLGSLR